MECCKIGCKNTSIIKSQKIAFRNIDGYIVRTAIAWCSDHSPESVLADFEEVELLRDKGAGY